MKYEYYSKGRIFAITAYNVYMLKNFERVKIGNIDDSGNFYFNLSIATFMQPDQIIELGEFLKDTGLVF